MKPAILLISTYTVCFFCALGYVNALDLPNLGDVFGKLMKSAKDNDAETEDVTNKAKDDDDKHIRHKRQNPEIGDESQLHYEVKSSSLPTKPGSSEPNSRYMPTLGNGHISMTVFNDTMYLNGLYEGSGSDSHRAMIPNILMSRITLGDEDIESRATRKYFLNAHEGYFMETIDCDFAYVEHRLYAHQKYIRLFINDIYVKRKVGATGGGMLYLNYPELDGSPDINFAEPRPYHANWQVSGRTHSSEEGASTQTVNMFWMTQAREISIRGNDWEKNETMVLSIDRQESPARAEFDDAMNILGQQNFPGHYQLFREHVDAWAKVWAQGRVELEGDVNLAKVTTFAQYYLLSSLPAPFPHQAPQHSEIFYGVGRNSLAKGGHGRDYQGHVMWDNEMYILPTVVLFQPNTAKKMMRYRSSLAPRAGMNAKLYGADGFHFPWESAYFGGETSPERDTCPECVWRKYHVTGAVGWGIRTYYSATRDRDYMINPDYNGCDMTREIARFFANRAVYNPEHGRYDIANCTGPDDNHPNVKNNAYTLAQASLAIHWARYFACLCQRNEREEVPDQWIQKALYLNLPFDNVQRLHNPFDGFDPATSGSIKQADTILLTYPLNWNMSVDIMKNDLLFYETITDPRTPALTWSFFTVGFKWVLEEARMQNYFLKSYQDYVIQPFKLWTEFNEQSTSDQDRGSVNFLPGMGGFLQSLVFGFAGIRIRPEMLEFHRPMLPPAAKRLKLVHMSYLGAILSIVIEDRKVIIDVHDIGQYPLILLRNNSAMIEESMPAGAHKEIENTEGGFYLYTSTLEACEHPRDFIYMPWGYSPFVDAAPPTVGASLLWTLCSALFALVCCSGAWSHV